MTRLVERVQRQLNKKCIVKGRIIKDGCKASLSDAPAPRVIMDFDKPGSLLGRSATRCDYLFVAESQRNFGWVALLELTKGQLHASRTVRQLQAGAKATEALIPSTEPVKFRPVAASGRISKAERMKLRAKSSRIRFHMHSELVRLMTCGGRLNEALRL